MSKTFKRYLKSSLITFLSAVGIVLLADIDNISLETLKDGSLVGVGFIAIRAGIKAVLELLLNRQ